MAICVETAMPAPECSTGPVMELVEEFLYRYRNGERPGLKEYVDRHPELAAEIRDLFPAVVVMESVALAGSFIKGAKRRGGRRVLLELEEMVCVVRPRVL